MDKKLLNILFVARDDFGCGFYRCLQPANFINRSGLAKAKHVLKAPTQEDLLASDLVVMQEMGTPEAMAVGEFCLQNKIPYIVEFDDFVWHVSPHNTAGYTAWNPSTLFLHRSIELTKKAMGVTVASSQLAREFFPYNDTVYVLPNYLDKDKWDLPIQRKQDGKIRIGWAGGNAHADDLKMISGVLDKIIKESKGKVVFETMGMTKNELAGVFLSNNSFNEVCPSCGYEGEVKHYPGEGLDNYPLVLASKGWDIGLAPVISNSFGNAKSDIKIKEYSATKMPIVASSVAPYIEASKTGASILFADTFEEWYNQVNRLINNPNERDSMVRLNEKWIKDYWIQENVIKMMEIYKQIIKKAELTFNINK